MTRTAIAAPDDSLLRRLLVDLKVALAEKYLHGPVYQYRSPYELDPWWVAVIREAAARSEEYWHDNWQDTHE
jgi:hypothetical protein